MAYSSPDLLLFCSLFFPVLTDQAQPQAGRWVRRAVAWPRRAHARFAPRGVGNCSFCYALPVPLHWMLGKWKAAGPGEKWEESQKEQAAYRPQSHIPAANQVCPQVVGLQKQGRVLVLLCFS